MTAINSGLRDLSTAVMAGVVYGQSSDTAQALSVPSASSSKAAAAQPNDWSDHRLDEIAQTSLEAIDLLRTSAKAGALLGKEVETERAAVGLVSKMVGLGMHQRCLSALKASRQAILDLYSHAQAPSAMQGASAVKAPGRTLSKTPSRTTLRTASPVPAPSGSPCCALDLLSFPAVIDGVEKQALDESTGMLVYSNLILAWTAALGACRDGKSASETLLAMGRTASQPPSQSLHLFVPDFAGYAKRSSPAVSSLYKAVIGAPALEEQDLDVRLAKHEIEIRLLTQMRHAGVQAAEPWKTLYKRLSSFLATGEDLHDVVKAGLWSIGWIEAQALPGSDRDSSSKSGILLLLRKAARKVKDPAIVEAVTGLRESLLSAPDAEELATGMQELNLRTQNADAAAEALQRDMTAATSALVLAMEDQQDKTLAVERLRRVDFDRFSAIAVSDNTVLTERSIRRLVQSAEQLRRALSGAMQAMVELTEPGLACLERMLKMLQMCRPTASPDRAVRAQIENSAVACAIDAANTTFDRADSSTYPRALSFVQAGLSIARESEPDQDQANYLRCLSCVGYNLGARLWRENQHASAIPLLEIATSVGNEALALGQTALQEAVWTSETWQGLDKHMAKRWEILAVACQKTHQKKAALVAFGKGFSAVTISEQEAVARTASTQPLDIVLSGFTGIEEAMSRFAAFIASEALLLQQEDLQILPAADGPFLAVLTERLVKHLEPAEHRPDVSAVMERLLRSLLPYYTTTLHPLRRRRVLAKLMELSCTTGSLWPALESDKASEMSSQSLDDGLSYLAPQYQASCLIWSAVRQHHAGLRRSDLEQAAAQLEKILIDWVRSGRRASADQRTPSTRCNGQSSRPRAAKTPATPPTEGSTRIAETPANASSSSRAKPGVRDDLDRFHTHIDAFLSVLDAHGLSNSKIAVLRCMRAVRMDNYAPSRAIMSSRLASEYARIGHFSKAARVFGHAMQELQRKGNKFPPEVAVEVYVRCALFEASAGNAGRSRQLLQGAAALSTTSDSTTGLSGAAKTRRQAELRRWIASAHSTLAVLALDMDDPTAEIHHLTAAVRIQCESLRLLFRLATEITKEAGGTETLPVDVFQESATVSVDQQDTKASQKKETFMFNRSIGPEQLKALLQFGALSTDLALALLRRGSAKEAEAVVQQCQVLVDASACAPMGAATAAALAEIALNTSELAKAAEQVGIALQQWDTLDEMQKASISRTDAKVKAKQELLAEAGQILSTVAANLQHSEAEAAQMEQVISSPARLRPQSTPLTPSRQERCETRAFGNALGPTLRQQSWILRQLGQSGQSSEACSAARNLLVTRNDEAEMDYLSGQLTLADTLDAFKSDLFMNSLTESSLTLPVGCLNAPDAQTGETRQAVMDGLVQAEQYFERYLRLVKNSGPVPLTRLAATSIPILRAYQSSLLPHHIVTDKHAMDTVARLDYAAGLTMERELLSAMSQHLSGRHASETEWPETNAKLKSPSREDGHSAPIAGCHWDIVQKRRNPRSLTNTSSVNEVALAEIDHLPTCWPIIHINLAEDGSTLLISRSQAGHQAIVFTLPLDRQGKREEEDEVFSFSDAITELRNIIAASDATSRDAKTVTTSQGRADWWATRRGLDKRMEELLASIEFVWLGAFKTIFMSPPEGADSELDKLKGTLESTFRKALLHNHDRNKPPRIELDRRIVRCFSSMGSTAKQQEYEDLVYYILDLHQFYGTAVALAELDMDQLCIDVQAALQTYEIAARQKPTPNASEHMFLVLDRKVQEIPWESLPILRGRSISRIPAVSFLLDRLDLTALRSGVGSGPSPAEPKFTVDSSKTHYILNPSRDLVRTQAHFEPWMREMHAHGWRGRVASPPLELDVVQALEENDLVLYFGHGGAQQYITSKKIRNLDRCAVTMLWGCSSGALQDNGDLDRTGTANHYMIGGCPSLIANLWDVTDKDIDKLTTAVMRDLHLDAAQINSTDLSMSNVQAVNRNRDECKLRYLTGAAPVVYGIPVYFCRGGGRKT